MVRGGALSLGLHALIFGGIALDLAFFSQPEPLESDPVIPIEMTIIGPETNQKVAGEIKEPDVPTPPVASATDEPPPPATAAVALPDTNTLVQDVPKPEPEPNPEPEVAEAPPVPAPRPVEPVRDVIEKRPEQKLQAREAISEIGEKLAALDPLPVPEAKPEPEPEPVKQPDPEPEPEPKVAKAPPTPPQPPKETPAKQLLDINRLSAKLDKLAEQQPKRPRDPDKRRVTDIRVGEDGVSQNRLNQILSVTEVDLLRSRLRDNWSPNHGAPGVERMQVLIRIFLNRDGTLARPPRVVDGFDAGQSAPVFNAFSESAMRAVHKSQPFPLPPEKYENWREIEINFNLREMYG